MSVEPANGQSLGDKSWYDGLCYACSPPSITARFKVKPDDFVVEEQLGFELSGSGEHVYLQLAKTNLTTQEVAQIISRFAGVHPRDVSYSGMKDKYGICTQWFSIYLPTHHRNRRDWPELEQLVDSAKAESTIKLVYQGVHSRKLKRGAHQSNRFTIRLRDLRGHDSIPETQETNLQTRLGELARNGFPNYFGYQRFGMQMSNVTRALNWLEKGFRISKTKKSLYISALRSFLFNELLSHRVSANNWNHYHAGDRLQLDGSNSFFLPKQNSPASLADEAEEKSIAERLARGDIHIGGLLPGRDYEQLASDAEKACLASYSHIINALGEHAEKTMVRPLRAFPKGLQYNLSANELLITFSLRSGEFATSLLREIICINDQTIASNSDLQVS